MTSVFCSSESSLSVACDVDVETVMFRQREGFAPEVPFADAGSAIAGFAQGFR